MDMIFYLGGFRVKAIMQLCHKADDLSKDVQPLIYETEYKK